VGGQQNVPTGGHEPMPASGHGRGDPIAAIDRPTAADDAG
jgi:hypothetical protein